MYVYAYMNLTHLPKTHPDLPQPNNPNNRARPNFHHKVFHLEDEEVVSFAIMLSYAAPMARRSMLKLIACVLQMSVYTANVNCFFRASMSDLVRLFSLSNLRHRSIVVLQISGAHGFTIQQLLLLRVIDIGHRGDEGVAW